MHIEDKHSSNKEKEAMGLGGRNTGACAGSEGRKGRGNDLIVFSLKSLKKKKQSVSQGYVLYDSF